MDVRNHANVDARGLASPDVVMEHMLRASYLIMPSVWYENFPRTLVEAFGCGLPVIASRIGALEEIVEEGRTGLLVEPGSAGDLAEKIAWAERNPEAMRRMGYEARREYEQKYTPEVNYRQLVAVYNEARSGYGSQVRNF
jgi:glycosyltransferase involved in cell wall biosynthesis